MKIKITSSDLIETLVSLVSLLRKIRVDMSTSQEQEVDIIDLAKLKKQCMYYLDNDLIKALNEDV